MKMVQRQKAIIQGLFLATKKTYHRLADKAGISDRPDKFEDLSYRMAQKIIEAHVRN
jgi:hypothetical protein